MSTTLITPARTPKPNARKTASAFGTRQLIASLPGALRKLDPLLRQLIWVHGAFIVLVIVGFGIISLGFAAPLAGGTPLARGVCLFIGLFWTARLGMQFFVFDARPFLKTALLKVGYHGLTIVFLYNAVVYSLAAASIVH